LFGRHHDHKHERRFARRELGFDGRHGRHWGRGGGRHRVFDHGDLRFLILHLVAEKPRYGYEVIKAIEDQLAGTYSPSPGVVYPTLTMLEELGYATVSSTEGGKKLYAVTQEGEAFLAANKTAVDAVLGRIGEVRAAYGQGPAPQILRAIENVRTAVRLRLSRGPLNDDQVQAVAAALDTAATTIERT
jgi:DNA-binding PadR family transcriptional regulator